MVSGLGNLSAEGTVPTQWNVLITSSTELAIVVLVSWISEMVSAKCASKAWDKRNKLFREFLLSKVFWSRPHGLFQTFYLSTDSHFAAVVVFVVFALAKLDLNKFSSPFESSSWRVSEINSSWDVTQRHFWRVRGECCVTSQKMAVRQTQVVSDCVIYTNLHLRHNRND